MNEYIAEYIYRVYLSSDPMKCDIKDTYEQIIRCKDCKHFDIFDYGVTFCKKWARESVPNPNGYCFLGEKETADDEGGEL